MGIKNSIPRLDAVDKVTGAAKYTEDLIPINALVGKTLHSTIANGTVRAIDVDEAWKIPGVVDILTCFDVPDWEYATCGHPLSPGSRTYRCGQQANTDQTSALLWR